MATTIKSSSSDQARRVAEEDVAENVPFFAQVKNGIFGVAFATTRRLEPVGFYSAVISIAINLAQMLAFPLHHSLWADSPAIYPIGVALGYTRFDFGVSHLIYRLALAIVATWVACFLLLVVRIGWNFVHEKPQHEAMLRVLASVAYTSTTILFLPTTSVLMRVFSCPAPVGPESWMGAEFACGSGEHFAIAACMGILLVLFALLSMFVAATFIDRDPSSNSWAARVHGRVDVVLLAVKLLLGFFFSITAGKAAFKSIGLPIGLMLAGCLWMYIYLWYMPLIHVTMNAMSVGGGAVFTWCSLGLFLHTASPGIDVSFMVLMGIPVVFGLAYLWTVAREHALVTTPLDEVKSVAALDVWGRAQLREYIRLRGQLDSVQQGDNGKATPLLLEAKALRVAWERLDARRRVADAHERAQAEALEFQLNHTSDSSDSDSSEEDEAVGVVGDGGGNKEKRPLLTKVPSSRRVSRPRNGSGDESETAVAGISERWELQRVPIALQAWNAVCEAEGAYRRMLRLFPDSHLGLLVASGFLRVYSPLHFSELLALSKAKRMRPPLDVEFWIYRRTRELRQDGDGGSARAGRQHSANMSVVDRVLFEQQAKQASSLRKLSFRNMVSIWEALSDPTPDLANVLDAGIQLHKSLNNITALYRKMLALNPESTTALRGYAAFLADQLNERDRALELLNKADRVEEVHSRSRAKAVRQVVMGSSSKVDFDSSDERSASVTISCELGNMGEVLAISRAACRMLNFLPSQLIGQNVATIVAPPFREHHNRFLYEFAERSWSNFVNVTRMEFVSTQGGGIVPVWIEVREAPPDLQTSGPRFIAMLQEVNTTEHHVIFQGADSNFQICAASSGSMAALGLSQSNIHEGEAPPITQLVPSLSPGFRSEELPATALECHRLNSLKTRQTGRNSTGLFGAAASEAASMTSDGPNSVRIDPLKPGDNEVPIALMGIGHTREIVTGSLQVVSTRGVRCFLLRWRRLHSTDQERRLATPTADASQLPEWTEALSPDAEVMQLRVTPAPPAHPLAAPSKGRLALAAGLGQMPDESKQAPLNEVGEGRLLPLASALPGGVEAEDDKPSGGAADDDSVLGSLDGDHARGIDPPNTAASDPAAVAAGLGREAGAVTSQAGGAAVLAGEVSGGASPATEHLPLDSGGVGPAPESLAGSDAEQESGVTPTSREVPSRASIDQQDSRVRFAPAARPVDRAKSRASAKSGTSGSTSSSGSSTKQLGRVLRHQDRVVEPEVRRIQCLFIVTFLAVVLTAIGGVLQVSTSSNHVDSVTAGLLVSGDRTIIYQQSVDAVSALVALNAGVDEGVLSGVTSLQDLCLQLATAHEAIHSAGTTYGKRAFEAEIYDKQLLVELRAHDANNSMELGTVTVDNSSGSVTNGLVDLDSLSWLADSQLQFFLTPLQVDWLEGMEAQSDSVSKDRLSDNYDDVSLSSVSDDDAVSNFRFYTPSLVPVEVQKQANLITRLPPVTRASLLPLTEFGHYQIALLNRIAQLPPEHVLSVQSDVRNFLANDDVFTQAINRTMQLRLQEVVLQQPINRMRLIVGGSIAFIVVVVTNFCVLTFYISRLSFRARSIMRLLLLIPVRVTKRLRQIQMIRLNRMLSDDNEEAAEEAGGTEGDQTDDENANGQLSWEWLIDEDKSDQKNAKAKVGPLLAPDGQPMSAKAARRHAKKGGAILQNKALARVMKDKSTTVTETKGGKWRVSLRRHMDTSTFVARRTALLLAPSFMVFCWMVFVLLYQLSVDHQLRGIAHRELLVALVSQQLMAYSTYITGSVYAAHDRQVLEHMAADAGEHLQRAVQAVVFGGEVSYNDISTVTTLGPMATTSPAHDLAVFDGCQGVLDEASCRAVEDGVIGNGALGAVAAVIATGNNILSHLPSREKEPNRPLVLEDGMLESIQRLHNLVKPHLILSWRRISFLLQDELHTNSRQAANTTLISSLAIVVIAGSLMFLVSFPVARSLAIPLRSARSLLPLIPETLVVALPVLRTAIRDVASSADMSVKRVEFTTASMRLRKNTNG